MHTQTIQYILELVEQDISVLEASRDDIIDRFLSSGAWTERDILHGKLLALAKVKGRLEAMIESHESCIEELHRRLIKPLELK